MTFYWDRYLITLYVSAWIGFIVVALVSTMIWTSSTAVSLIENSSLETVAESVDRAERKMFYPDRHVMFAQQAVFENPLLNLPENAR